jgi:hypothetical protein
MKNRSLNTDLKTILAEPSNISKITKGGVSSFSIDIEFVMPQTFSSYTYYDNKNTRDEDFKKLEELISEK